ncbi:unnamed protein product [Brachionus calyciflorus]|uniref:NCAM n=1 Tax=Brachionus calyciflorus TaxID=104777 RepID=A0A813Q2U5_9BILA|nr:unnamed protein product [Brachionus calyciflorus]
MIRVLVILIINTIWVATMPTTTRLTIMPRPYESNKVKAVIDENFFMTCIPDSIEGTTTGLRWLAPNGEIIPEDPFRRVYSSLKDKMLLLHFEKLIPSDAGVYTCQGVQDGIVDEAKSELSLEKKISFYDTPFEQFIRSGQDQLVTCHASSIPGPEIAWFKKGISTTLKNDHKYQITNDGLVIKNTQIEDEGIYLCQASVTSTGEIKRADINVNVMHEPIWDQKPIDTDGVNNQDIVIKCKAHAKPAPVYNWYRNGILLAGDRYVKTSDSLRIIKSSVLDRGTYTCEAENNSGKIQANFRLNILVGPIISPMEEVRVIEGDDAVIKCVVQEAFPKALITWKYADNLELITPQTDTSILIVDDSDQNNSDGNLIGSWSELRIKPTNRNFNRNITCVASNKAEVTERTTRLYVDYKPNLLLNSEARDYYYSWLNTDLSGSSGSSSSLATRGMGVRMTCLASGEPKPQITWYFKTEQIKHDNVKYILHKDELGLSQIEIVPQVISDFGDYQCKAENRVGASYRNIELRLAGVPKLPPIALLKSTKPESINFEVKLSDAPDADGGLPVDQLKFQWRFLNSDWSNQYEKNVPVDNMKAVNVEINTLLPDTEYLIRVAGVNKVGLGAWSKDVKIRTLSRRQPDSIRVLSKEDCHASTRCHIEWTVDSNGGSPIREYHIRWRRISYKDSNNQHVNTDKIEPWSSVQIIKAPLSSYEIVSIQSNSFYEVDVIAMNDIGPSASQPFRIRTLPGQIGGESEAFKKTNESIINRIILISGSVIAAIILFIIIDVLLLMKFDCGLLAILTKSCGQHKDIPIDYKPTPTLIAQHQPKSNTPYQPINQTEEPNADTSIPMDE